MARRRMIDPNFWGSEDVSKLNHTERLMLIGMFSTADDFGKGRANAAYVRSSVFPYEDIPLKEIEKNLSHIQEHIEIVFYEIGDGKYYKFKNWSKWQKVDHPTDSIIPDPQDSETIRERFENDSRNEPATTPPNIIKDNIIKDKEYTDEFEKFYAEYPRSEDKRRSFTNWKTCLKSYTVTQLMQACMNYKKAKTGTDRQYLKSSANFLGKEKPFEDYLNVSIVSEKTQQIEKEEPEKIDPGFLEYCKALDEQERQQKGGQ